MIKRKNMFVQKCSWVILTFSSLSLSIKINQVCVLFEIEDVMQLVISINDNLYADNVCDTNSDGSCERVAILILDGSLNKQSFTCKREY